MKNQKWVIFDLDNTITNCQHRVHLAEAKKWDEFNSLCHLDEPNHDVIEFVGMASEHCNIAIVTGRSEQYRGATIEWLCKYRIPIDIILMRPNGDHTPSGELKICMLEKFFGSKQAALDNVLFALDDRDKDTKAIRDYGLICYQVRNGAF